MIVSLERTSDENVGNVLRCLEMSEQFIIAHYFQDIQSKRKIETKTLYTNHRKCYR